MSDGSLFALALLLVASGCVGVGLIEYLTVRAAAVVVALWVLPTSVAATILVIAAMT